MGNSDETYALHEEDRYRPVQCTILNNHGSRLWKDQSRSLDNMSTYLATARGLGILGVVDLARSLGVCQDVYRLESRDSLCLSP